MSLAKYLEADDVDLGEIWTQRATLFPRGLTNREGQPAEGLLSAFALSAAYPMIDAEVPPDVLRVAATQMEEPIADLESRKLDAGKLADSTKNLVLRTFASPADGGSEGVEVVVGLIRELIGACRTMQDLRTIGRVLETIAGKMEIITAIAAVELESGLEPYVERPGS